MEDVRLTMASASPRDLERRRQSVSCCGRFFSDWTQFPLFTAGIASIAYGVFSYFMKDIPSLITSGGVGIVTVAGGFRIGCLRTSKNFSAREVEYLQDTVTHLTQEKNGLNKGLVELKSRIANVRKDIVEQANQIEVLQRALNNEQEKNKTLKALSDEQKAYINDLNKQENQLKSSLVQLREQLQKIYQENKKLYNQQHAFAKESDELDENINDFKKEVDELEDANEDMDDNIDDLSKVVNGLDQYITRIEQYQMCSEKYFNQLVELIKELKKMSETAVSLSQATASLSQLFRP